MLYLYLCEAWTKCQDQIRLPARKEQEKRQDKVLFFFSQYFQNYNQFSKSILLRAAATSIIESAKRWGN